MSDPKDEEITRLILRIHTLVDDNDALRHERDVLEAQNRDLLASMEKEVRIQPLFADLFYECDGPPRAYFELFGHPAGQHGTPFVRGEYETLLIYADDEASAYRELRRFLEMAADLMEIDTADSSINPIQHDRRTRFLIWRRRPEWRADSKALYCRFWISGFSLSQLNFNRNDARQFVWHDHPERCAHGNKAPTRCTDPECL